MKTKNSFRTKLSTKLDLRLKLIIATSVFAIVLTTILFVVYNMVQKDSEASVYKSGTYKIGGGLTPASGCTYSSLTAALNDLSKKSIKGPVTFVLTSAYSSRNETFPIVFKNVQGASDKNRITIKADNKTNIKIKGSSASSILKFEGSSFYTIDGHNSDTTTRHLSIINTCSLGRTAGIWISSLGEKKGSTNIIIKNCYIEVAKSSAENNETFGIFMGGVKIANDYGADYIGADNDVISIVNNEFFSSLWGFWTSGTETGKVDNLIIMNNNFRSDPASDYIGMIGFDVNNLVNSKISGNYIYNITSNIGDGTFVSSGMMVGKTSNCSITKNIIKRVKFTGSKNYPPAKLEVKLQGA
jgi:hypothetical protein